jgi:tetratricopeptide (TPR) repeat protein
MRSAEQGRPDQAIVQFERAVRLEQMLPTRVSEDSWSLPDRALLHFNYGVALHRFGRENDALTWLRTAAKEKPDDARFLRTLADAYFANARAQEGDSLLRRVSLLEGGEAQLLLSEGWRAARSGQLEDAERLFGGAVRNDPHLYGAWGALIRVQVERGALRRADSTLASAARIGMPRVALLAHRALVDAASGRDEAAREALQNIPEAALAGDPMAATVAAKARLILTRRGP